MAERQAMSLVALSVVTVIAVAAVTLAGLVPVHRDDEGGGRGAGANAGAPPDGDPASGGRSLTSLAMK